jgi:hypothetical protein
METDRSWVASNFVRRRVVFERDVAMVLLNNKLQSFTKGGEARSRTEQSVLLIRVHPWLVLDPYV